MLKWVMRAAVDAGYDSDGAEWASWSPELIATLTEDEYFRVLRSETFCRLLPWAMTPGTTLTAEPLWKLRRDEIQGHSDPLEYCQHHVEWN